MMKRGLELVHGLSRCNDTTAFFQKQRSWTHSKVESLTRSQADHIMAVPQLLAPSDRYDSEET